MITITIICKSDHDDHYPRYEIDMTCPDNTTRGVYRGRDTECVVASLLPGRPYMFQVSVKYFFTH